MTTPTLYDPRTDEYSDPAAARAERDRTFQICADCRLCVKFCYSFKTLFRRVDEEQEALGPNADHHDAVVRLSDADHDQIVAECFQCKQCYVNCPYTLDKPEADWKIDFPALMLRSLTITADDGRVKGSARLLARTDLQGRIATTFSGLVNGANRVGLARTLMEKTTGISRVRMLPKFARQRFSKWFRSRGAGRLSGAPRRPVALFPSCLVEYQNPAIGRALVEVYERNGIACELPDGQVCCGMPWLDAGDTEKFLEHAERNLAALAPAVRAGRDVVVPQPTCAYVLRREYPSFVGSDDARLVAEHTFDSSEYLLRSHREEHPLDTQFDGTAPETVLWHSACHYRAQQIGPKSAELLRLTGAKVEIIERCSAIDGTWGLRAENVEMARQIAKPLMDKVRASDATVVVGDCNLANTAIAEDGGRQPLHPLEVLAQAYGAEGS